MKRIASALAATLLALPVWAAEMGDDGLYKEPWMQDTFKDLREDLADAAAEGKRLALFVEQRGCVYCHEMHEKVYSEPGLSAFIGENFHVVQINLHGDTEITDLDGESLSEKEAARKWRVLFTPTVVFLPEDAPEGQSAVEAAVAVMPGAFAAGTTTDMFTWVAEKRYLLDNGEDFQRYHARRIQERDNGRTD
ncbi:thioredoxin family protein [Salipiger sp.]|uniref:thioredoxin family protein n=1 Tax=Salipiger sp. TaxID=2078585 RepID=UPI003A9883A8